jgi:hypothetical protein
VTVATMITIGQDGGALEADTSPGRASKRPSNEWVSEEQYLNRDRREEILRQRLHDATRERLQQLTASIQSIIR